MLCALQAVHVLCEAGADMYARTFGDFESTITSRCVLTGDVVTCNVGSTPLHLAAQQGSLQTVMAVMSCYRQSVQRAARGSSLPTDPRLIQDAAGSIPFAIAMQWSHSSVMNHLHPLVEVESLFSPQQEAERSRVPKLKEIAAMVGGICVW